MDARRCGAGRPHQADGRPTQPGVVVARRPPPRLPRPRRAARSHRRTATSASSTWRPARTAGSGRRSTARSRPTARPGHPSGTAASLLDVGGGPRQPAPLPGAAPTAAARPSWSSVASAASRLRPRRRHRWRSPASTPDRPSEVFVVERRRGATALLRHRRLRDGGDAPAGRSGSRHLRPVAPRSTCGCTYRPITIRRSATRRCSTSMAGRSRSTATASSTRPSCRRRRATSW